MVELHDLAETALCTIRERVGTASVDELCSYTKIICLLGISMFGDGEGLRVPGIVQSWMEDGEFRARPLISVEVLELIFHKRRD